MLDRFLGVAGRPIMQTELPALMPNILTSLMTFMMPGTIPPTKLNELSDPSSTT